MAAAADTRLAIARILDSIPKDGILFMALEGNKLSRHGSISLMTLLVHSTGKPEIDIIDVQSLPTPETSAFTMLGADGKTLKSILEDASIPKAIWDVRPAADALWAHHKIRLAGVIDLQLLENRFRLCDNSLIELADALEFTLELGTDELVQWGKTRHDLKALNSAGNIFSTRPLDPVVQQYCENNVKYLPALHQLFKGKVSDEWMTKVMIESLKRVQEACSDAYKPPSEAYGQGPWG